MVKKNLLKILIIGDIFGRPGRNLIKKKLPDFIKKNKIDVVIANGENLAGGLGITTNTAKEILNSGVNIITTGNHAYNKTKDNSLFNNGLNIVRPINYAQNSPGIGYLIFKHRNFKIAVINALGQLYMEKISNPFIAIKNSLQNIYKQTKIIIVDFHAEATSEKKSLGWYLDGYVSAVVGTHTHIQTADEVILPQGTAYITDLGMTGSTNSVIGVKTENMVKRFVENMQTKFEVGTGKEELNAVEIKINTINGKAVEIKRIKK